MISQKQIEHYRETGYLVVHDLVSSEHLRALHREVDEAVARSADVRENDAVYDLEQTHSNADPRVRRIKEPHKNLPTAGTLMRDPGIVSVLTRLVGPGVRFQTSKLNMKSPGYGAPVEWHQDWAFYPHTNDDLLAVGVILDDVGEDNGPLMVVPGSHRGPILDHHSHGYFCGAIDPQTPGFDVSNAVALTGQAGSVTFHHVRAIHGSAMNRSTRPRRLLLYQYTAVDAWPLVNHSDDIDAYDALIVAGEPTRSARLEQVPVRLPLPPAPHQGSIYENQRDAQRRYFERADEPAEAAAE